MAGVTYDTGALIAAERGDRRMWARHAGLLAEEVLPTVPVGVLAEAWRGGSRHANLARFLAPCIVDPFERQAAERVGVLLGQVAGAQVVDASVVEGAARRGDAVVTSDPDGLDRLAQAAGVAVRIERT